MQRCTVLLGGLLLMPLFLMGQVDTIILKIDTNATDIEWFQYDSIAEGFQTLMGEDSCSLIVDEPGLFYATYDDNSCNQASCFTMIAFALNDTTLEEITLQTIDNESSSYQWLLNGSPIPGATGHSITTQDVGIYQVVTDLPNCPADTQSFCLLGLFPCMPLQLTLSDFMCDPSGGYAVDVLSDFDSMYVSNGTVVGNTISGISPGLDLKIIVFDTVCDEQRDTIISIPGTMNCFSRVNISCHSIITPQSILTQSIAGFEHLYTIQLLNDQGLIFSNPPPVYVTGPFRIIVMNTCTGEMCESVGTIKIEETCAITNTLDTSVFCFDPFLKVDPLSSDYERLGLRPEARTSCSQTKRDVEYQGEWITEFSCFGDTAKLIERIWTSKTKDGTHCYGRDSIYVLRLPELTSTNFHCPTTDTLYCGSGVTGAYLVFENANLSRCDTLHFIEDSEIASFVQEVCGLKVLLEKEHFNSDGCANIYSYELTVLQDCFGRQSEVCSPADQEGAIQTLPGGTVVATCKFWVIDLDTTEARIHYPENQDNLVIADVDCDGHQDQVLMTTTTEHHCSAPLKLPELCIETKIAPKSVKAVVDGIGTFLYERMPNQEPCDSLESSYRYSASSNGSLLPKSDVPIIISIEVLDSCHRITKDTVYTIVVDKTPPVVVASKSTSVALGSDPISLSSDRFHAGSNDACSAVDLLARRQDWVSLFVAETVISESLTWLWTDGHDTLWTYDIESIRFGPKAVKHYLDDLSHWQESQNPSAIHLLNLWKYAMLRKASENNGLYSHHDVLDKFHQSLAAHGGQFNTTKLTSWEDWFKPEPVLPLACEAEPSWNLEAFVVRSRQWHSQGGGWSTSTQFTCADACRNITIDLLAIDHGGEVNLGWTAIQVDPANSIQVDQDLTPHVEISCAVFHSPGDHNGESLQSIASRAALGQKEALQILDDRFGTFQLKEVNEDESLTVDNVLCECFDSVIQVIYQDPKLGALWKDSTVHVCREVSTAMEVQKGLLSTVCSEGLSVESSVHLDLDPCGSGTIYRKFIITQSCGTSAASTPHRSDTLVRTQRIVITRSCKHLYFESTPKDLEVYACGLTYGEDGNVAGAAATDLTGIPVVGSTGPCTSPLLAHQDKVHRTTNGGACQKIIRTWYLTDGCHKLGDEWWLEDGKDVDSFKQEIRVIDTSKVGVHFEQVTVGGISISNGQVVEFGTCDLTWSASIAGSGLCGGGSAFWQLLNNQGGVHDRGEGLLNTSSLEIGGSLLEAGKYKMDLLLRNSCGNEGHSSFEFEVVAVKKPALICLSQLTAVLTPVDSSQFAVAAAGFIGHSAAACQDDSVFHRIELVDGIEDDSWQEDHTSVLIKCPTKAEYQVRVWAISYPSLAADFCDVTLLVQSHTAICVDSLINTNNDFMHVILSDEIEDMGERKSPPSDSDFSLSPQSKVIQDPIEQHVQGFALMQNTPNPFDLYTNIEFVLPREMHVELTITDITGSVLVRHKGHYPKGRHTWQVRNSQLLTSGMLYYRMEAGPFHAVRKMVFMRE